MLFSFKTIISGVFFYLFFYVLLILIVACFSFNKKSNSNAQGGQSRVNPTPVNSAESNNASLARTTPNGAHVQPQFHGKLGQCFLFFNKIENWLFTKLVF